MLVDASRDSSTSLTDVPLEDRFLLNVIKIGQELTPIGRQRTDAVALLFALAVDAEAVREVDVPGLSLPLVLRVFRQPRAMIPALWP